MCRGLRVGRMSLDDLYENFVLRAFLNLRSDLCSELQGGFLQSSINYIARSGTSVFSGIP
jgi:hypothetical protein